MVTRSSFPSSCPRIAVLGSTLGAFASFLEVRVAEAQGNSFVVPIGGRSALMGNTGTALAVDGAAPFLNPATIVRMDDQRFAFAVNFYSFSITHFANWHVPGAVDSGQFGTIGAGNASLSSQQFTVLPSTLCVFFTLVPGAPEAKSDAGLHPGRHKLSLCLGSLESQSVGFASIPFTSPTSLGETSQAESLLQSWNRFYAGPSYSVSLSNHLALGVSLHAVYTTESFVLGSSTITSAAPAGGVQSSFDATGSGGSFDVAATVGGIYRAGRYTMGLSAALPGLHLLGTYTGTLATEYSSDKSASASVSSGAGSFSAAPPVRVAFGLGAEGARLIVEGDAALVIPAPSGLEAGVSGTTTTLQGGTVASSTFESSFRVAQHVVVNPGVGAEYFVKPTLSVVGGVAMNFTLEPALSPTLSVGNLIQQRESLASVSLGVGSYGPAGSLMLGTQLGYSWGQSLAANPYVTPNQWAVVDSSAYTIVLILAGTTSLRALGSAAIRIERAIVGDPAKLAPDAPGVSEPRRVTP